MNTAGTTHFVPSILDVTTEDDLKRCIELRAATKEYNVEVLAPGNELEREAALRTLILNEAAEGAVLCVRDEEGRIVSTMSLRTDNTMARAKLGEMIKELTGSTVPEEPEIERLESSFGDLKVSLEMSLAMIKRFESSSTSQHHSESHTEIPLSPRVIEISGPATDPRHGSEGHRENLLQFALSAIDGVKSDCTREIADKVESHRTMERGHAGWGCVPYETLRADITSDAFMTLYRPAQGVQAV